MLIDCNTCIARDIACRDCVVTVLLQRPPLAQGRAPGPQRRPSGSAQIPAELPVVELDEDERQAIATLVDAGLVPPLRLVAGG